MSTVDLLRVQANTWAATGITPQKHLLQTAADELESALVQVAELEAKNTCPNCCAPSPVCGVCGGTGKVDPAQFDDGPGTLSVAPGASEFKTHYDYGDGYDAHLKECD